MKALEILKRIYINNPDTRFQRNNIDINFTIHDFSNVNEAIKELETLENRSCDNCNFSNIDTYFTDYGKCEKGYGFLFNGRVEVIKDFCCNKWEAKK